MTTPGGPFVVPAYDKSLLPRMSNTPVTWDACQQPRCFPLLPTPGRRPPLRVVVKPKPKPKPKRLVWPMKVAWKAEICRFADHCHNAATPRQCRFLHFACERWTQDPDDAWLFCLSAPADLDCWIDTRLVPGYEQQLRDLCTLQRDCRLFG